ncbi:hypothetical protein Daus18300_012264 [Diaporthe australafricana]|uniref:Restriction of telomere capping protein 4 n=1 Tax=Diaporthe australafricana TaxID=127596 RepID=A0ABR3W3Y6_9PEZI
MPPIQLTRNISPLLRFVNGKPTTTTVKPVDKPMEEPEDATAPPIDSEEDENDVSHYDDPHYDSTDGEPARGDMNRSVFKPVSVSQKPNTVNGRGKATPTTQNVDTPQRRSAQSGKKRAVEGVEDADADEPGVFSSKKRVKSTSSTNSPFLGSHMNDGFLVDRKIKPPKAGYGKKAGKTAKALNSSLDTPPRRKFERVKSMSESVSPQVTKRFFGLPESVASSPVKNLRGPRASRASVKEEESSSHSDMDSGNALSDPPRPRKGQRQDQKQKQNRAKRQPKTAAKSKLRQLSADEDISQRPEFRMPDGYDDFAYTTEVVGIDMPQFPDSKADETAHLDPDKAPCPMCDEPVDKQWLSEYSKGQRMSISRQAKFCHLHKKRSARVLWEAKGYPKVDWGQLEARIESHRGFLESLINGAASHFGERLREKIRTGENRTLFTTDDYPIPGYYGLRGMSAMTEGIVDAFSSLLRERAPRDRLISARGHTAYVQAVLVPELGVRLIMEDMGIGGEGEARAVMRESRAVGVILNDDRGERQAASQAQAVSAGEGQGDAASEDGSDKGNDKNASGTDGESEDHGKVDLRIQRVDDSDSDLSSLASLGDHKLKAKGKGRVDDSHPALASLASLGRAQKPKALGEDVVDDSDSDLSSLASLDQL